MVLSKSFSDSSVSPPSQSHTHASYHGAGLCKGHSHLPDKRVASAPAHLLDHSTSSGTALNKGSPYILWIPPLPGGLRVLPSKTLPHLDYSQPMFHKSLHKNLCHEVLPSFPCQGLPVVIIFH